MKFISKIIVSLLFLQTFSSTYPMAHGVKAAIAGARLAGQRAAQSYAQVRAIPGAVRSQYTATKQVYDAQVLQARLKMQSVQETAGAKYRSYKDFVDYTRETVGAARARVHVLRNRLLQHPGKTLFGSIFLTGLVTDAYCSSYENPYTEQIREELIKAAADNNVQVVELLCSIDPDQENIRQALWQQAATNSSQIKHQVDMSDAGKKDEDLGKTAAQANLATFATLLSRFANPVTIVDQVMLGNDVKKLSMLLQAGVPLDVLLNSAVSNRKSDMLVPLLLAQDKSLTPKEALVLAEHACNPGLLRRVLGYPVYKAVLEGRLGKKEKQEADAHGRLIESLLAV